MTTFRGLSLMLRDLIVINRGYRRFYETEPVALETVGPDGDIRYWRDDNDVHHVPKRRLDDIIISTSQHLKEKTLNDRANFKMGRFETGSEENT